MKFSVWNWFVDYEKEEKWLNEMSAKGFHFVHNSFCRYIFEEGAPGKYVYRLQLLDNLPSHPESRAYIRFMEEAGAEHVSSILRWVYFRKKASEGSFDLYSDLDSRIKHYGKIALLLSFPCGYNLFIGLTNLHLISGESSRLPLFFPWLNIGLAALIAPVIVSTLRKMSALKKEKQLRE